MGIRTGRYCIGRTRYSAGIFLSDKIAGRKPYAEHLKLETFSSFEETLQEFFKRFPMLKQVDSFKLNKLYQIKEKPGFVVYWSKYTILIGEGFDDGDVWTQFFKADEVDMFQRHFDDYEDAQDFARGRFVSMWKCPELFIRHRIKIGVPIDIDEEFS